MDEPATIAKAATIFSSVRTAWMSPGKYRVFFGHVGVHWGLLDQFASSDCLLAAALSTYHTQRWSLC